VREVLTGVSAEDAAAHPVADAQSYNPKLWIDPVMKEAAYPSVC